MIVCTKCGSELSQSGDGYICSNCSFAVQSINGIVFFEPDIVEDYRDYQSHGLDNLYRYEHVNFWFKNRAVLIKNLFDRYIGKDAAIIDIGAGTGYMARSLADKGYDVAVGEIHNNGLEYAKKIGITKLYQFDIFHPPFIGHFDVVTLFDVIEHFDNDLEALEKARTMLKPGGFIVCTVPAYQWLWSNTDIISSHKRRYSRKQLETVVMKAGFELVYGTGFYVSLIPLLLLRKMIHRNIDQDRDAEEMKKKSLSINPLTNTVLKIITFLEISLIKYLRIPWGGSLVIIARKY